MGIPDRLEHFRRRYVALQPGWEPATTVYQRCVAATLTPACRVLDLGCGRGGIVERLGTTGIWVGVDPDLLSLQQHRAPKLPRSCTSSERLPFGEDIFDVVVASWVLEHLPDPQATFCEVARVLRPGGAFMFLTPNARHPIPRLSVVLAQAQTGLVARAYGRAAADTFPVSYRANTAGSIERLAVAAGLRLGTVTFVGDPAYFAWNDLTFAAAVALEQVLPPLWKVHLVGEFRKPQKHGAAGEAC